MKRWFLFAVLLGAVVLLVSASASAGGKKTHLGGSSDQILNLVTQGMPNDNSGGHMFQYDDTGPSFSVPENYSFVVTDISVTPQGSFAPTENFLVVIQLDEIGYRTFVARFTGGGGFYHSFSAGLVIPSGSAPTARNTTSSTSAVTVEMRGYYVKGDGLPPREPVF